jgi:FtsP/CotA-like multicopper oxidase with cupredoxin domain
MIDGRSFSGDRYDQTMILGDYEEWTLTNSTSQIAHPFHIHVNPFQVEIYDPNASGKTCNPGSNFVWRDVIAIPPSKLDNTGKVVDQGYVKIRLPFVDFAGSFVLHCHMQAHEDRGMMQLIRVIRADQAIPIAAERITVPHH